MNFGSKYVYNYSEEESESYDEDEIQAKLDDIKSRAKSDGKKKKKWRKADTNVLSVKFDHLASASNMHTGDPTYCTGCGAITSCISSLQNQIWKCEFCNTANTVDFLPEEIPQKDDVTYMLQPAETGAATQGQAQKLVSGDDGSLVVFCVDMSGSMSSETRVPGRVDMGGRTRYQESRDVTLVSRLDAVKVAVTRQLQEIAETSPETRVALITFDTEVRAIGDGSSDNPLRFDGGGKGVDELKTMGRGLPLPQAVSNTKTQLTDKVCDLRTQNMTALGPALLLSVAMATNVRGSKVIICTDGMANVGLGQLSSYNRGGSSYDEATQFYTDTANYASQNGVSISVITFEGTDCRLAELGHVAAITEGHVNIVDPLKLTEEFGNILIDRTVATNVTATFIIHQGMYFRNEENVESKLVKEFGNVSKDTEITFEYGIRRDKKKKKKSETAATVQSDPAQNSAEPAQQAEAAQTTAEPAQQAEAAQTTAEPAQPTAGSNPAGSDEQTVSEQSAAAVQPGTSADAPSTSTDSATKVSSVDHLTELPFQLQIIYTDMAGAKAMRVLTQKKPVTKEREKAESYMKAHVMATHATKINAGYALKGQYKEARMNAKSNFKLMDRNQHKPQVMKMRGEYLEENMDLYDDLNALECGEQIQYGRTLSDSGSDSDDEQKPTGAQPKSKKKAVIQKRQQMRQDKASKGIFSKLKKKFVPDDDDDDEDELE